MKNKIYLISLLDDLYVEKLKNFFGLKDADLNIHHKLSQISTPCFYFNLKDARKALKMNTGGLDSCRFTYAVIEEYDEGYFSLAKTKGWFKFENKKWTKIETPIWTKGICNFGLG